MIRTHVSFLALAVFFGLGSAMAQSITDLDLQVHGYAAQGFLYTSHNKMFYTDSDNGSPAWTEAVINISVQPEPKLSVAVQGRYAMLGTSGNTITLDWAAADYKVNNKLGVRFGKVKTPWGLFNETQDIDQTYLWALLPQSIYDITTRNADLSHYGGVVYGRVNVGSRAGKVDYKLWGGEAVIPTSDGQFDDLNLAGNGPQNSLTYPIYGGALHWNTPLTGLMVGASDSRANQTSVLLHGGTESFAAWNNLSYFAKYEKNKVMVAAEWNRQASPGTLDLAGHPVASISTDTRGWYAMASYRLTDKLNVGAYHSQYFDRQAPLSTDRFTKDWAVSAKYNLGAYVYLKAEQHFIDGSALSLDSQRNPDPSPIYHATALKIGVSF